MATPIAAPGRRAPRLSHTLRGPHCPCRQAPGAIPRVRSPLPARLPVRRRWDRPPKNRYFCLTSRPRCARLFGIEDRGTRCSCCSRNAVPAVCVGTGGVLVGRWADRRPRSGVATLTLVFRDEVQVTPNDLSHIAAEWDAKITPGLEMDLEEGGRLGILVLQGGRESVESAARAILSAPGISHGRFAADPDA
jgi:hypothetical protein